MTKTTKNISISIPTGLYEKLDTYAKQDKRSISNMATIIIEEALNRKRDEQMKQERGN